MDMTKVKERRVNPETALSEMLAEVDKFRAEVASGSIGFFSIVAYNSVKKQNNCAVAGSVSRSTVMETLRSLAKIQEVLIDALAREEKEARMAEVSTKVSN